MWLKRFIDAIPQAAWLALYKQQIEASWSPESAIYSVLTFLRRRPPFDQISVEQAGTAAHILSRLPDPSVFTQVVLEVERQRNVRALTNFEELQAFVDFVNRKQGRAVDNGIAPNVPAVSPSQGGPNIDGLCHDVVTLLDRYIVLHDSLLKQSRFPRGLIKAIDFELLTRAATDVLVSLGQKESEIKNLLMGFDYGIDDEDLVSCLAEYTAALRRTVTLFVKVVADLAAKAQGQPLSMSEHLANYRLYEQSIDGYGYVGKRLKNLYQAHLDCYRT